jgi:hypothetical protein
VVARFWTHASSERIRRWPTPRGRCNNGGPPWGARNPFIGVGHYGNLQELAAPRTFSFLRYGEDAGLQTFDAEKHVDIIDSDGSGPAAPLYIGSEDFNYKLLVSKAVFRWEWRPGSRLYVAWTRSRFDDQHPGDCGLPRCWRALSGAGQRCVPRQGIVVDQPVALAALTCALPTQRAGDGRN